MIRIQATWRGFRTRFLTKLLKKSTRMKKKYFLEDEFWETLSKTKIYD